MSQPLPDIRSFNLQPGRALGNKYIIESKLGSGWQGEVYKVEEEKTGVSRAAKLFFPQRNKNDAAVTFYARKLERLRDCPIIIKYHHSETIRFKNAPVTVLISDYVEGELLEDMIRRQPGKRFPKYEAFLLLYSLARGLEDVHAMREYHGDMHQRNVLVRRRGIFFDVKLVDMYHWGAPSAANIKHDVLDLIRMFYDALGGQKHYASQPPEVKGICLGLKKSLVGKKFPTARHLREHLERFDWKQP